MKTLLTLCIAMLTTTIVHAENMQIAGFEVTPTNGISICLTSRGKISQISTKAGTIKRNSANIITSIGGFDIHRDGGIITSIGHVSIQRDSEHVVTNIGSIKIKRDISGLVSMIGNATVKRNSVGIITNVNGDPRVCPVFELTEESD